MLEILFVFGRNKDCTLKDPLLCSDLPYPLVAFDKPQALPAKSSTWQPTYTLSSITSVPWWTGSTYISTGISRWRTISAINSSVTRLTIHFAGINVPITEPPCITSLTFTAHVYKLAVSIICVAFFWFYALTIMLAGAHFNGRTPNGAGILVVDSNESQTELRGKKNYFVNVFKLYFSCSATTIFNHQILTLSALRSAKTTTVTKRFWTVYVLLQLCMRNLRAVFHVGLLWLLSIV